MSQKSKPETIIFQKKQLEKFERYQGVQEDSILFGLYLLSKQSKHRAVITQCTELITKGKDSREYYAFLASSYYALSKKDSATKVTLEYLSGKPKESLSLSDMLMFSKYPTFLDIFQDASLNKKMLDIYLDAYKKYGYPETDLGIELIRLAHNDQRIRFLNILEMAWCKDSTELLQSTKKFEKAHVANAKGFLQLYNTHPDYITTQEVGEEASAMCQNILMDHISDSTIRYTRLLPMLKRAMEKKNYPPDAYVNSYIFWYMRQGAYDQARRMQDSLCKIYHCVNKVKWEED